MNIIKGFLIFCLITSFNLTHAQWSGTGSTISTSQNVGIGVNGPRAREKLHVFGNLALSGSGGIGNSSSFSTLSFRDGSEDPSTTQLANITYTGNLLNIRSTTSASLITGNNSSNYLSLFGGGNVTIGNLNPSDTDMNTISFTNGFLELGRFSGNGNFGIGTSSPAFKLQVKGDTDIMGELTILSDRRYKKDINMISGAIEKVLQLNPVHYNYRSNSFPDMNFSSKNQMGFVAQDVESVLPELVSTGTKAIAADGTSFDSKSVNYIELIPLLTKAIQEQQEQIELLKNKIIILKSK